MGKASIERDDAAVPMRARRVGYSAGFDALMAQAMRKYPQTIAHNLSELAHDASVSWIHVPKAPNLA